MVSHLTVNPYTENDTPAELAALRQNALADSQRPRFHFSAPANWLNDPNGLIQWQGQYHLFYQYNPHGAFHGSVHWGHAVSQDLTYWQDLPIALTPTPGGTDALGCWSGCAVDDNGVPTLIYTGVFPQVVCLATSSDKLLTWQKYAGNPVLAAPPPEIHAASGGDFRDPYVWWAKDRWYLVIGTKVAGEGGLVLLYQSQNLRDWEYLHPILRGDANQTQPFSTGAMWECPNLLDFGDKQALIISAQTAQGELLYAFYSTGVLTPEGLAVEKQEILVYGGAQGCFYAPQVMRLGDGQYVLWGWLKEGRSEQARLAAGWAGAMSLPLTVSLAGDGGLRMEPVPELAALRDQHWRYDALDLAAEAETPLADIRGACLEIAVELELGTEGEIGFKLRCSPDGREYTEVSVQPAERRIVINRSQSSLSPEIEGAPVVAPLAWTAGESIILHIFLDCSILEVFANGGRSVLASRIYPILPESLGVSLFSRGGSSRVKALDVWTLKSIW